MKQVDLIIRASRSEHFSLNTLESVYIVRYCQTLFILYIIICYIYNIVCKITIGLSKWKILALIKQFLYTK